MTNDPMWLNLGLGIGLAVFAFCICSVTYLVYRLHGFHFRLHTLLIGVTWLCAVLGLVAYCLRHYAAVK